MQKILICHATHAPFCSWSIPKGLPQKNENCWRAACRELFEETGINISTIKVIEAILLPPHKYKLQKKQIHSFLVLTSDDFRWHNFQCRSIVKHKFPEIDQWKWLEIGKAKTLLHESQRILLPNVKKEVENQIKKKNQKLYE